VFSPRCSRGEQRGSYGWFCKPWASSFSKARRAFCFLCLPSTKQSPRHKRAPHSHAHTSDMKHLVSSIYLSMNSLYSGAIGCDRMPDRDKLVVRAGAPVGPGAGRWALGRALLAVQAVGGRALRCGCCWSLVALALRLRPFALQKLVYGTWRAAFKLRQKLQAAPPRLYSKGAPLRSQDIWASVGFLRILGWP
jgi:hypothetical protein